MPFLQVMHANAEADLLETGVFQLLEDLSMDVIAAGVQTRVGCREPLAGSLIEADGLGFVQQRLAAGQGQVLYLLAIPGEMFKFACEISLMSGVIFVILLVGVEAIKAVAMAFQGNEESGAAHAGLACHARRRDGIDDNALAVISEDRALLAQPLHFLSGFSPVAFRIDFDPHAPDLLDEVFVDPRINSGVRRQAGILDPR